MVVSGRLDCEGETATATPASALSSRPARAPTIVGVRAGRACLLATHRAALALRAPWHVPRASSGVVPSAVMTWVVTGWTVLPAKSWRLVNVPGSSAPDVPVGVGAGSVVRAHGRAPAGDAGRASVPARRSLDGRVDVLRIGTADSLRYTSQSGARVPGPASPFADRGACGRRASSSRRRVRSRPAGPRPAPSPRGLRRGVGSGRASRADLLHRRSTARHAAPADAREGEAEEGACRIVPGMRACSSRLGGGSDEDLVARDAVRPGHGEAMIARCRRR